MNKPSELISAATAVLELWTNREILAAHPILGKSGTEEFARLQRAAIEAQCGARDEPRRHEPAAVSDFSVHCVAVPKDEYERLKQLAQRIPVLEQENRSLRQELYGGDVAESPLKESDLA
jgi:hypothetical protein